MSDAVEDSIRPPGIRVNFLRRRLVDERLEVVLQVEEARRMNKDVEIDPPPSKLVELSGRRAVRRVVHPERHDARHRRDAVHKAGQSGLRAERGGLDVGEDGVRLTRVASVAGVEREQVAGFPVRDDRPASVVPMCVHVNGQSRIARRERRTAEE